MRYRLYEEDDCIGTFTDRDAFFHSFLGNDPNSPVGGIVMIHEKLYQIKCYEEIESSQYSENEFHEIDSDWFAHLSIKRIQIPLSEYMIGVKNP